MTQQLIAPWFFLQCPHTNQYITLFFSSRHKHDELQKRATRSKTMLHIDPRDNFARNDWNIYFHIKDNILRIN